MVEPAAGEIALNQSTYEAIKSAILGNRLRPGNKLTHQGLAELLGVSRTPVREALERLYQEGYVVRYANRGFFVVEINATEARELYETREALETFALSEAIHKGINSSSLRELKSINKKYKDLIQKNITLERLQTDRQFHLKLAESSNNRYLCKLLETIFDRVILKRRVEGYTEQGLGPWREHCLILDAIELNDQQRSINAMREHIRSACSRFVTHLVNAESTQTKF